MDDKYLWDRTGEPDPEIQKLEELLGTLRYQPRRLEIPADIRIARKRNFVPLAIAAAIALVVIGAALWLQISRSQRRPAFEANNPSQIQKPKVQTPENEPKNPTVAQQNDPITPEPKRQPRMMTAAYKRHREPRGLTSEPALTPEEQLEKEQVLIALRLVSAKLNLAQRKTQGLPPANNFRNQHKIG